MTPATYAWGLDLSGDFDQAGGVGGLLLQTICGASRTSSFAAWDGNGNVTALVDGEAGAHSVRREYDPFGHILRETGPLANVSPFGFSTKYRDAESALLYYGLRYYAPALGRWTSRDPADVFAAANLYACLDNQPTIAVDTLGESKYYPGGHHVATMALAKKLLPGPGTEVLKTFTIPVTEDHCNDGPHRAYNVAVQEFFDSWCAERKITKEEFARSAQLANEFLGEVMAQPANSKLGGYLRSVGRGAAHWGGKALKAAVVLGSVFGAASSVYAAYQGGLDLVDAADQYELDIMRGSDSATLDLDAINAAVAVQTMSGDYFVTMGVLSALLQ